MSQAMQAQVKAPPAIKPVALATQSGLLQRQCACGGSPGVDGECAECRAKRVTSPRSSKNTLATSSMSPTATHNFSNMRVHNNVQAVEPTQFRHTLLRSIGQDNRRHVLFSPHVDPRLPNYTPAWTENSNIHLSLSSLFMSPPEKQKMLRHEAIHSLHQYIAPQSETTFSRERAERLAMRGENNVGKLHFADFLHAVPTLLAYPPQKYSPWTTVWIGNAGLVGEVEEAGVKVRIFQSFEDIHQTGPQSYVCGKHDGPPIPDLVKKMRNTARKIAELNAKIPEAATQKRVALVVILANIPSKLAEVHGQGLIMLKESEFEKGVDIPAHEGAHAVFEYHLTGGSGKQKPDTFALRIADLFNRLGQTKLVPIPTRMFDRNNPPEKSPGQLPAGQIMVEDVLWNGIKGSGHSSENADEFFASAYAGFLQNPELLHQSINYYQTIDPTIKPLAEELFGLLMMVDKPKNLEKLAAPMKSETAQEELKKVRSVEHITADFSNLGFLIEPANMPTPEAISCSSSTPRSRKSDKDPFEDITH